MSFSKENDIDSMRKHTGYVEVKNDETPKTIETESPKAPTQEVLKRKPGRPRAALPSFLEG